MLALKLQNVEFAFRMKLITMNEEIREESKTLEDGAVVTYSALEERLQRSSPMERGQLLWDMLGMKEEAYRLNILNQAIKHKKLSMMKMNFQLMKEFVLSKSVPKDTSIWKNNEQLKNYFNDYDCDAIITEHDKLMEALKKVDKAVFIELDNFYKLDEDEVKDFIKNDQVAYNRVRDLLVLTDDLDRFKYLIEMINLEASVGELLDYCSEKEIEPPHTQLFYGVTFVDPKNEVDVYRSLGAVHPERDMKVPIAVKEKQLARANERDLVERTKREIANGNYSTFFLDVGSIYDDASCCEYDSYDGPRIRQRVLQLSRGKSTILINTMMICLFFGNNFMERYKKCMDPQAAESLIKSVASLELVRKKGAGQGSLTPSRVASAFAPVMFAFRKLLEEKNLLPKTGCSEDKTPLLYQDLSLSPLSDYFKDSLGIDSIDYLQQMAEKFRQARIKKDSKLEIKPEDAIAEMEKFRKLAVLGFKEDIISQTLMQRKEYTLEDALKQYGFHNH